MFKFLYKTKQPLPELSVRSGQTIIPGPILTIENIHGTYYNPTINTIINPTINLQRLTVNYLYNWAI